MFGLAYSPPGTGGVAAPSNVGRRGRGGHSRLTTPSALFKELRNIFLMRSHLSCPRRGIRFAIFQTEALSCKPATTCLFESPSVLRWWRIQSGCVELFLRFRV